MKREDWLVLALVVLILAMAIMGGASCRSQPKPTVKPIEVVTTLRDCLEAPPPVPPPTKIRGNNDGCEPPWAACLDVHNLIYVIQLVDYAKKAWQLCGSSNPAPISSRLEDAGPSQ